ncbi:energy transducer TonB [Hymenobacter terricola]|uniref:energy transducer TonB n=1 Tax=Hymenobacter terricola TaxID=2819236 RepID=UPI001B301461|nr:energy transducer TonB [Hymenobacter terricola]
MKTQPLFLKLALLAAGPLASHAQAPPKALPSPPATFFREDAQPATQLDSAAYCAETVFRDSLSAVTRVYYPSGHLKQYIPYANAYRGIRHGTLSTWYEDGQMRSKEEYMRGQRNGDLFTYYPDGGLKRREHYENGRCGIGRCYGPDGAAVPYFIYEQLPLYPGGPEQLTRELTKAVRLTAPERDAMRRESNQTMTMLRRSWLREIDVELAVAPDGRISNARVVHSTASFLNNAALRAVAKLKRQFVPGRRDGQVLMSYLTVPVYYTLETPYRPGYGAPRGYGRFR